MLVALIYDNYVVFYADLETIENLLLLFWLVGVSTFNLVGTLQDVSP